VAANLFGLTPGTEYYYRLDARNASGTVDGQQETFTTTSAPVPVVTTGAASAVTEKSASLAGTLSPSGSPTSYWFEYGTTSSYGSQTATRNAGSGLGTFSVAANVYGLMPGTEYYYRLDARNATGTVDGQQETFTTQSSTTLPAHQWFAGTVGAVGSDTLTVGVSWTGPHDGSLNGQTVTVAVPQNTRIDGPHGVPIALAQIQQNDLVALRTEGTSPSGLTALRIHVYCNCHWVGGTISAIDPSTGTFSVQVHNTGPYDTVLKGQDITLQTNNDTVYLRGRHGRRIGFGDLALNEGVGVVFSANGFFQAPGFNWSTATFTAARVHVWGSRQIPSPSSDADSAAQTSVSG
jgi:hypothetical protein